MNDLQRAQAEADAIATLLLDAGIEPTETFGHLDPTDETLLARILATEPAAPRPSRTSLRRRRALLQAAAAACIALLAVVGVGALQSSKSPALAGPPPTLTFGTASAADLFAGKAPSAAAELRNLAAVADAQLPASEEGSPHIESYGWYASTGTDAEGVHTSVVQAVFQSATVHLDGSVTSTEDRSSGLDVNGKVVPRKADPTAGKVVTDELPAGTMDPHWVNALPRDDDDAMRTAMLDRQGGEATCPEPAAIGVPYCMFLTIQEMWGWQVVPSQVAASAWRTLANEHDVYLLGQTVDRVGRLGIAVAVMEPPNGSFTRADIMIISPTTGQLLSWEWIEEAPQEPAGATVTAFQAITSSELIRP
ncbi:hypothetical protein [Cellulomonas sp. PhB150]|uniref:hypothetical protein n=1 Tax=Cellulomonas sp. PhB150 TaxID=2485188 RepID=UPI000F484E5F|nr:hypothetical protein [Cellulomonas sp. PhB150]ROS23677.1 hypothetical protein EDF34_2737 [Cellulomonas sp. PhB150]